MTQYQGLSTPVANMEAREARLSTRGGETPVYVAKPAGAGGWPIILVAQEIFGLNEHIRNIVRRFAALGYCAVAPDFFARFGDVSRAKDIDTIRAIVAKTPDDETMADFDAALDFAREIGGDPTRAAIIGFCWGGRIAWLYAAHNSSLRAAVPWYGRLDGDHTQNQPRWPVDIAGELKVPTMGLYGGADASIPPAQIEEMRARLGGGGASAEIHVYDGAPHAFFADYRESFRPEPARDAWARTLQFLRAHGVH